jgi:hypothetical protein
MVHLLAAKPLTLLHIHDAPHHHRRKVPYHRSHRLIASHGMHMGNHPSSKKKASHPRVEAQRFRAPGLIDAL